MSQSVSLIQLFQGLRDELMLNSEQMHMQTHTR